MAQLAAGGELHIVDFGDFAALPSTPAPRAACLAVRRFSVVPILASGKNRSVGGKGGAVRGAETFMAAIRSRCARR